MKTTVTLPGMCSIGLCYPPLTLSTPRFTQAGEEQPQSLIPVPIIQQFGGKGAQIGDGPLSELSESTWSLSSLESTAFPIGYYHLTTLEVNSLAATQCQPGSFGLVGLSVELFQVRKGVSRLTLLLHSLWDSHGRRLVPLSLHSSSSLPFFGIRA